MPGGQCHFTDSSSKGCWRDSALGRQELLQKFFRPVPLVLMKSKSLSWASHDCLRRCVSKAVRFSIIWHSVTRFSEKYLNLLEKGKVNFQAGSLTNDLYGGSDPGLAYALSSLHEKDSTSHAIFHLGCPMNLWLSIHVVGSAVCSSIRYQKNIWFCSHNITAYLSFSDSLPSMWCWHPFFFFSDEVQRGEVMGPRLHSQWKQKLRFRARQTCMRIWTLDHCTTLHACMW